MQTDAAHPYPQLALLAASLLTLAFLRPPEAVPADAPADRFSAHRARKHVEAIAREPHILASPELRRVRSYLVGELEALGLEIRLQETTAVRRGRGGLIGAGPVVNLAARLPGKAGVPSILLAAHYDSMPRSPGAADDGAGVAALLETARTLAAGPRLDHDVLFLFSDGEEAGLLGAQAFVDDHPWFEGIGAALNFEARGNRGPSLMFETGPENAPLIRALARSPGRTFALSWASLAYGMIGNRTDFTVLREAGIPGLNFAFIHGASAYHSREDTPEHLDLASLQHHGEYALGLVRELDRIELEARPAAAPPGSGNRIYFDLLGLWLVSYPEAAAPALALLLVAGLGWLIFRTRRDGRITLRRVFAVAAAGLAGAGLNAVLCALLARLLFPSAGQSLLAFGAVVLVAVGLAVAGIRGVVRRFGAANAVAGGLLVWAGITLLVSFRLPAASYLFAFPLAVALIAATLWLRGGRGSVAGLAATAVVAGLLWTPSLALLAAALGPPAAGVAGLAVTLLCFGPLAAAWVVGERPGRRWTRWLIPAAAASLVVAGFLPWGGSSPVPAKGSLFYEADLDRGEARWLSQDERPDPWTRRFLGASPDRGPQPRWFGVPGEVLSAPAPWVPDLPAATLRSRPQGEDSGGGEWELVLEGDCQRLILFLEAEGLEALTLAGRRLDSLSPWVIPGQEPAVALLFYQLGALEAESADRILRLERSAGAGPLEIEAVCQTLSLPASEVGKAQARPESLLPQPGWFSDSTLVRRTFELF